MSKECRGKLQLYPAAESLSVAVVDIGKPGKSFGWALSGPSASPGGSDIDECVATLAEALRSGPLALGFEAPMFVPMRDDPTRLTKARKGECVNGLNRPFSAAAGASVLVTALVVVPYVLERLKRAVPDAIATLDWTVPPSRPGSMLLFEAFVTNQRKTTDTRHVEDARAAIAAFCRELADPAGHPNPVSEDSCLSLLGAMMTRTGWSNDVRALTHSCLVVRA